MKLLNTLSIVTVALFAVSANAKTTVVNTTDLTKLQPVTATELMQSVELTLADSIKEMNLTLAPTEVANTHLKLAKRGKTSASKQLLAKTTLVAE